MKTAIGPVTYFWPKSKMLDFYHQVADSQADLVYLGETVCSKRRKLSPNDYLAIAQTLRESGKQVVLSTLTLIEANGELNELRRYCDNGEFLVEANDMSAVQAMVEKRLPFVVGPAVNIYNAESLMLLVRQGMVRWTMPVELSRDWLARLLSEPSVQQARSAFEVEVFAFGYLPLAYSARCFTARSEHRSKDECGLCCINYPDGRRVTSQDGQEVFTLNGIQTQSGSRYNLIDDVQGMKDLVDVVRISPQSESTLDWLNSFREVIASSGLTLNRPSQDVNGYWHKLAGIHQD